MFDLKQELNLPLRQVVLWQWEQAKNLQGIIDISQAGYDELHRDFWANWYDDVFNIETAKTFGLRLWAKILQVKLTDESNSNLAFSNEQVRILLLAKFFKLTNRPTMDNVNRFLQAFFSKGDARAYITDQLDMTNMVYTFMYNPSDDLKYLLDNVDFLPRPFGVGISYRIIAKPSFGLGTERRNFAAPSNFGVIGQEND